MRFFFHPIWVYCLREIKEVERKDYKNNLFISNASRDLFSILFLSGPSIIWNLSFFISYNCNYKRISPDLKKKTSKSLILPNYFYNH